MRSLFEILLERKNSIMVRKGEFYSPNLAHALMANIATLGYTFSQELLDQLCYADRGYLKKLNEELPKKLKEMKGAHVRHVPLFRDFPDGVPDDTTELLFKRIFSFLASEFDMIPEGIKLSSGETISEDMWDMSNYSGSPITHRALADEDLKPAKKRPKMEDEIELTELRLASSDEAEKVLRSLIHSNTPLSQRDMGDISILMNKVSEKITMDILSNRITMRENVALITGILIRERKSGKFDQAMLEQMLEQQIDTATDVLRVVAYMNDADLSLEKPFKVKLSRPMRKLVMSMLESVDKTGHKQLEDVMRHREQWVRIAHAIHSGEFKDRYPAAFKALDTARNEKSSGYSFESKVQKLYDSVKNSGDEQDLDKLLKLLTKRPSEFARRLDSILTQTRSSMAMSDQVVSEFKRVVDSVKTGIVLQLASQIPNRTSDNKYNELPEKLRTFFPKAGTSKVWVTEDKRPDIPSQVRDQIEKICLESLLGRFSELDSLGAVSLNPELSGYALPTSMRSASDSLKTIPRGSKMDMPEGKHIRMFIHWMENEDDRIDVDLSASMYDSKWKSMGHVSYTNLKNGFATHSGDLTSAPAPRGASEFIDFDPSAVIDRGCRYIVMQVYSFTGQLFSDMPVAFAGYMEADDTKKGEHFEAKRVQQKFDLTSSNKTVIPMIFDCQERKIIWCDMGLKGRSIHANYESSAGNVCELGIAMTQAWEGRPDMYMLSALHAAARAKNIFIDSDGSRGYIHNKGKALLDVYNSIMEGKADELPEQLTEAKESVRFSLDGDYSPLESEKVSSDLMI